MITTHATHPGPLQQIATIAKVASPKTPVNSPASPVKIASMATSGSTTASATDPSDITGSDFLTLLVSELKNQDPTQPTDPTTYVQQLVGVNSLQQLIDINQTLTNDASGG